MSQLRSQLTLRRENRFYGHQTKQAKQAVLYLEANYDFDDPDLFHTSWVGLSGMEWNALEALELVNKLALHVD